MDELVKTLDIIFNIFADPEDVITFNNVDSELQAKNLTTKVSKISFSVKILFGRYGETYLFDSIFNRNDLANNTLTVKIFPNNNFRFGA